MAADGKKLTPESFDFGDVLGEGAYAKVLTARLKSNGASYAVKIVDKKFIMRYNKQKYVMIEKQCLSLLNHPNIIKLYFTFQDEDFLYFVLEIAPNGELYELIKQQGTLSLGLARFFAAEIVNAMSHVHAQNIWHRDLKPENLLLSESYHIKLTDFGTAKINVPCGTTPNIPYSDASVTASVASPLSNTSHNVEIDTHRTSDVRGGPRNSFVGTAEYVAPEILKGGLACSESDFWSTGVIIYQMLCGRPPFHGASEYLTFQQILNQPVSYPPDLDPEARSLIEQLLVVDPKQRLGSPSNPGSGNRTTRGGWDDVRNHAFFNIIDFSTLHTTACPDFDEKCAVRPVWPTAESNATDAWVTLNEDEEDHTQEHEISQAVSNSVPPETIDSVGVQSDGQQWYSRFLLPAESVVFSELLIKGRSIFSKKRQLILTSQPRFLYIDIERLELKGTIDWSVKLWAELTSAQTFIVHTPTRDWYFESLHINGAPAWIDIINNMRRELYVKQQQP